MRLDTDHTTGPPAWVEVFGFRWHRLDTGYYQDRAGNLLHHAVWAAEHGPIPDGHVVHHVNHDKSDNRLSNLSLMGRGEHVRHHHTGKSVPSDQGRKGAEAMWAQRQPRTIECAQCGSEFKSIGTRARFCQPNCRARFYRQERREALNLD